MGQRGPGGLGEEITIGTGAGMVTMGYEIDGASLRPLQINIWPEGA